MPSEITGLKGYNPETGEPGECLFRGVHNNVRMDPVIGLIYPLPKKLFEPIEEMQETISANEDHLGVERQEQAAEQKEEETLKEAAPNDIVKDVVNESKQQRLDRIKEKGKRAFKENQTGGEEKQVAKNTIRSSAWDSDEDEFDVNGKHKGEDQDNSKGQIEPQMATKNRVLNDLEEKLAQRAEAARYSE